MPSTYYGILAEQEVVRIHESALRVLAEVGVRVESEELLALLGEFGGSLDHVTSRVRFPVKVVEQFIADSDRYDWTTHRPAFRVFAGIYGCEYLNPETQRPEPFTEETFRDYIRLATALRQIDGVHVLGIPFITVDSPPAYGPLTEKLYGWKHGGNPCGTVQFTSLCPYIEEMYARRAEELGRPLEEVFHASGFLISPLRLARAECEQILHFRSRGLRVAVGHLLSLGSSTPITLAGAATLSLAESLFLGIFNRSLWDSRSFGVGAGVMVMDMRTTTSMYGRPEQTMISAIFGQVARWYGVGCGSQAGLTDAKEPSAQAGMQKAASAVAGIHSCGSSSMDAGLLSIDEICSPEQLVYDAELASSIRRMLEPIDVSDEALAISDIAEVGPGGTFVGTELTAKRFRQDVWEPTIWARESLKAWQAAGAVPDRERAKQRIRNILSEPPPEPGLSEECERDLRSIIARAVAADAAQ